MSQHFADPTYLERCQVVADAIKDSVDMSTVKAIVDLGCGMGGVGQHFEAGAQVLYIDGRLENIERLWDLGKRAMLLDVERQRVPLPTADLVLCLGLLYHSLKPMEILENCSRIAPRIAVESLCADFIKPVMLPVEEDIIREDQSLHGWGCALTASWIETALRHRGYDNIQDISYKVPDVQRSDLHLGFTYNWQSLNDGERYRNGYGLRKLWIATKTKN